LAIPVRKSIRKAYRLDLLATAEQQR